MTEQFLLITVLVMIVAVYVVPAIMWLSWSIPHRTTGKATEDNLYMELDNGPELQLGTQQQA